MGAAKSAKQMFTNLKKAGFFQPYPFLALIAAFFSLLKWMGEIPK